MGGRGASSGISVDGRMYGTEYTTLHRQGNIKFIRPASGNAKPPLETMTRGRVYVLVNAKNDLKSLVYFDKHNKKYRQVDMHGHTHNVNGRRLMEHTHKGYFHDENGTSAPSPREKRMIERVRMVWYNHLRGKE